MTLSVLLGTLALSGVDGDGTEWVTSQLDGWAGSPASGVQLTARPYAPGSWPSPSPQLGPRVLTVGGGVSATTEVLRAKAEAALNTAVTLASTVLTVDDGTGARSCTVQRQGEVLLTPLNQLASSWSVQLVCPDPRKFGADLTASTGLPSSTGGQALPVTLPFSISASRVSGQCSLTNPGDTAGPVTARIVGPCSGTTSITHTSASDAGSVWAMDLELGSGEWVDVLLDPLRQQVLAQGTATRAAYVTRRGWSSFDPGLNTWTFASSGSDQTAVLTVTATPTWQ